MRAASLDVALVGCGHMGRRHAAVIASDPGARLVATVDVIGSRAEATASRFGGRAEAVVPATVDAVVVATPTSTHVQIAAPLLDRGQWCLVEKPLATGAERARALASERCAVGHVERFNPALRAAGWLRPRVVEARRIAPPSGRSLDVDVVMDLMIHDLDLVLEWMAPGATVTSIDAAGVSVGGRHLDAASVRLRSSCGLTASMLASRVAGHRERLVRCYEPGRYTELDLLAGRARVQGRLVAPPTPDDALTAQWRAFTDTVRGARHSRAAPSTAGLRAVALAERILQAMTTERS